MRTCPIGPLHSKGLRQWNAMRLGSGRVLSIIAVHLSAVACENSTADAGGAEPNVAVSAQEEVAVSEQDDVAADAAPGAAVAEQPSVGGNPSDGSPSPDNGSGETEQAPGGAADASVSGGDGGRAARDAGVVDGGAAADAGSRVPGDVTPDASDSGPTGACNNVSDRDALGAVGVDIAQEVQGCALSCALRGNSCSVACIERNIGVSEPCADCFADSISCTISRCALVCLDASSGACARCQQSNCTPAFAECAGITPP